MPYIYPPSNSTPHLTITFFTFVLAAVTFMVASLTLHRVDTILHNTSSVCPAVEAAPGSMNSSTSPSSLNSQKALS